MTLKGLLLLVIAFLVARAIRSAMRASSRPALDPPASRARPAPPTPPRVSPHPRDEPAPPSSSPPPASSPGPRTPHEVLGVAPDASPEQIRAAYQRLARQYHPDRLEGLAPELVELAHQRMVELNAAYEALKAQRGD
jgi:DnaJ-domain-containing protein 1